MAPSKVENIDVVKRDGNGEMPMPQGWEKVQRHHDIIGRSMPYARRSIYYAHDYDDEDILWSIHNEEGSKRIMFRIDQRCSPNEIEPLPLQTKESVRKHTLPNGRAAKRRIYQPHAVYKSMDVVRRRAYEAAVGEEKVGACIDVYYPLFKVYEVYSIQRVVRENLPATKGGVWEFGTWTRNDEGAADWDATHLDGPKLVRGPNGYWHHPDCEIKYWTKTNMSFTKSTIDARKDLGLSTNDDYVQYLWILDTSAYDVLCYEAHMEWKIKQHNLSKAETAAPEEEDEAEEEDGEEEEGGAEEGGEEEDGEGEEYEDDVMDE